MKKIFMLITFILITILEIHYSASCKQPDVLFSISCCEEKAYRNSEISILLSASAEAKQSINISTYKISLHFDQDILTFKDLDSINPINDSEFKFNLNDSCLDIIFLTEDEGINVEPNQSIDMLKLNFKVKGDSEYKKVMISYEIEGVGDYQENYLTYSCANNIHLDIENTPKFDCRLKTLYLNEIKVEPEFNPDIYDYTASAPSDCSEISLCTEPYNEDAIIKTNRQSLKKPGEETVVKVSVYSPHKKDKLIYRISVKRDPKEKVSSTKTSKGRSAQKDKKCTKHITQTPTQKEELDINPNNRDPHAIVLKENSFSFIIFFIVIFIASVCLFLIWKCKKTSDKLNTKQKDS